jgi:hypothetical protein
VQHRLPAEHNGAAAAQFHFGREAGSSRSSTLRAVLGSTKNSAAVSSRIAAPDSAVSSPRRRPMSSVPARMTSRPRIERRISELASAAKDAARKGTRSARNVRFVDSTAAARISRKAITPSRTESRLVEAVNSFAAATKSTM